MLMIFSFFISVSGTENKTIEEGKENNSSVSLEKGWYYLPSYDNYAPSGMPDFSQKQNNWKTLYDGGNGIGNSVAIGDDIQVTPYLEPIDYENNPSWIIIGPGPDCYLDTPPGGDDWACWTFCGSTAIANCFYWLDSRYEDSDGTPGDGDNEFNLVKDYGAGDDHSFDNVPLLVEEIAVAVNNTGLWNDPEILECFGDWFKDNGLDDFFTHHFYWYPTFEFVASEIKQGKAVLVRFYIYDEVGEDVQWIDTHWVSCAGVNTESGEIAICNPGFDTEYVNDDHNDAQYVSHDIYEVDIGSPHPDIECEWWLPDYPDFWLDYYVVANALVINASDLSCEGNLNWVDVTPGSTVYGSFTIENTGDNGSMLDWNIPVKPGWSTFTFEPDQGENVPAGKIQTVNVTVVAPEEKDETFTGKFKIQNGGYNGDYCYIDISLTTPKNKPLNFNSNFIDWLFAQFPNVFPILRYILD